MTAAKLIKGNYYLLSNAVSYFNATFNGISQEQTEEDGIITIATFTAHMDGEDHFIPTSVLNFWQIAPFNYK